MATRNRRRRRCPDGQRSAREAPRTLCATCSCDACGPGSFGSTRGSTPCAPLPPKLKTLRALRGRSFGRETLLEPSAQPSAEPSAEHSAGPSVEPPREPSVEWPLRPRLQRAATPALAPPSRWLRSRGRLANNRRHGVRYCGLGDVRCRRNPLLADIPPRHRLVRCCGFRVPRWDF